ncbi:diguanylate cyclase [Candidatus Accumulibacter vicinus]|uniref:diguanylate cyclase n=1 Tax=Candidatus Accumulibacter vicinus TaxID=2954382 RepID=A0A084XV89_9PROT|nr:diguanylate cyclase [Candidatus Accumulibacter vicinus]KFB66383.1 MAG: putative diguanylate cyclase AdrA [Candidatus Accumulibacter vicinus]
MIKESIKHIEEWANPRTVIVVTLLLVGALWLALMVSVVSDRHQSIATTGGLLQRMTLAVEEQTRQKFRVADTFLTSCEHWLQANPDLDPRTDKTFRQLIETFRARTDNSIDIYLLAGDGQMFDILDPAQGPLANVADRDYFKGALNSPGLFFGSPTRKPLADHDGLPISLSLRRPTHDIQVLLAVIDLPTLTRSYEKQRQPGGAITLLKRDGTVLARAPLDDLLPGHSMAGEVLFSEHLAQQPQALVLPDASPDTRAREFISYSSMPDFPLVIMVSEDYDEALAAWLRQTAWVILLGLGVTLPLAVIAYRSLRLLQALASQDAELQRLTTTDLLTGSSSRQHFFETLTEEVARARRRHIPLTIVLFDIDFFQRINDGYGHAVGDQALILFANTAKEGLRDMDLLGRLGGGEFALLLPNTGAREAVLVAERIRTAIPGISIPSDNGTVQFTVSVGVSEVQAGDTSIDDLLKRATAALHNAKAGGYDRVAVV